MNNKGNKAAQKENEVSPGNKYMEICDLSNRFKIAVWAEGAEGREARKPRQFNELRNKINKRGTLPKRLKL